MTAGNNGTNKPEGDDPFGYLYQSEDGAPEGQQAGVPRTSYNHVRAVGERRYGQQRPQQDAQSPSAYYAAPETQPVGPGGPHGGNGGRGAGPRRGGPEGPKRRNGLLIGALAVVAAVVLGVGAAVAFSDDDSDSSANPDPKQSESADAGGDDEKDDDEKEQPDEKPVKLPSEDASSLRLDNGPKVSSDIEGSRAKDGAYISDFDSEGAAATWTPEVPEGGKYTVFVGYSVPGEGTDATLSINGKPEGRLLNLGNFANAEEGEWADGWTQTFAWVNLNEGQNEIKVSCEKDNECKAAFDRVWLAKGHVKR